MTGAGNARVLRYTLANLPAGAKVTFVERGNGGGIFLGKARGTRGTLASRPLTQSAAPARSLR